MEWTKEEKKILGLGFSFKNIFSLIFATLMVIFVFSLVVASWVSFIFEIAIPVGIILKLIGLNFNITYGQLITYFIIAAVVNIFSNLTIRIMNDNIKKF